jgi:hypothetical protein
MTKYRIFHHSYQQSLKEKHSISIALDFVPIFVPIQSQLILNSASSLSKT